MSEPTSHTSPVAQYPPYPGMQRSRAPEYYGFVAWTATAIAFVVYLLWAILPDHWIQAAGVTWYPSRSELFIFFRQLFVLRLAGNGPFYCLRIRL